jgi:hypothetical protein
MMTDPGLEPQPANKAADPRTMTSDALIPSLLCAEAFRVRIVSSVSVRRENKLASAASFGRTAVPVSGGWSFDRCRISDLGYPFSPSTCRSPSDIPTNGKAKLGA